MKKYLIFAIFKLALLIPFLSSCDKEVFEELGDKHSPVELDFTGIEANESSPGCYEAAIPATGTTFTYLANGKSKDWGYLKFLYVLTKDENDTLAEYFNHLENENIKEELFAIDYLSIDVPYRTQIKIEPNNSDDTHIIRIGIGNYPWSSVIRLTQPPLKKQ